MTACMAAILYERDFAELLWSKAGRMATGSLTGTFTPELPDHWPMQSPWRFQCVIMDSVQPNRHSSAARSGSFGALR